MTNLIIETEKGQETIQVNTYRPSDRYSNGSFVIDTEKDGQFSSCMETTNRTPIIGEAKYNKKHLHQVLYLL